MTPVVVGTCNNNAKNSLLKIQCMGMSLFPVHVERQSSTFDLYECLKDGLRESRLEILSGDVITVSTKFAAISEGRIIQNNTVHVSDYARHISDKYRIKSETAEVILRESDYILGGMSGFVLTSANGMMAPNAGIDASNAGYDRLILYPASPHKTAETLRRRIFLDTDMLVGIILADSRLMPGRVGTVGVAVACAGLSPVIDMRGCLDLDGRPLKVTFQAVADSMASASNYIMGEGSQSIPYVVVRGSGVVTGGYTMPDDSMYVDSTQCIYRRSLSMS